MDYKLMTNSELKSKCSELEEEFNETKMTIQAAYDRLNDITDEFNEINEILLKREGKNNTNGK